MGVQLTQSVQRKHAIHIAVGIDVIVVRVRNGEVGGVDVSRNFTNGPITVWIVDIKGLIRAEMDAASGE